jgi:hypothetical protein
MVIDIYISVMNSTGVALDRGSTRMTDLAIAFGGCFLSSIRLQRRQLHYRPTEAK